MKAVERMSTNPVTIPTNRSFYVGTQSPRVNEFICCFVELRKFGPVTQISLITTRTVRRNRTQFVPAGLRIAENICCVANWLLTVLQSCRLKHFQHCVQNDSRAEREHGVVAVRVWSSYHGKKFAYRIIMMVTFKASCSSFYQFR